MPLQTNSSDTLVIEVDTSDITPRPTSNPNLNSPDNEQIQRDDNTQTYHNVYNNELTQLDEGASKETS